MPKKSSLHRLKPQTRRRDNVSQSPSRKLSTRKKVWLHPENENSHTKVKQRFAIGITFVTALAFIYFITSERDFFDVRAKNVSVIGDHSNSAKIGVAKQTLIAEKPKRKPIALLKYNLNQKVRFLQVDSDGYILNTDSPPPSDSSVTIVASTREKLPEPHTKEHSEGVQLALRVLRSVQSSTPELASKLRSIDANQPDKITLQLDDLTVVWLSVDLLNTGIKNINLFLKNRTTIVKPNKRNRKKTYLDARFEDAIYLGRIK